MDALRGGQETGGPDEATLTVTTNARVSAKLSEAMPGTADSNPGERLALHDPSINVPTGSTMPMHSLRVLVLSVPVLFAASTTLQAQYPPPIAGQGVVVGESNGLPIGVPETTGGYNGEPLQRFDVPYPWMHGYFQEIPPYEGYGAFRPYNYKHIFSQAQTAGGWGMSPRMPYAQQFWHRYRKRALMSTEPTYSRNGSTPSSRGAAIAPARYRR